MIGLSLPINTPMGIGGAGGSGGGAAAINSGSVQGWTLSADQTGLSTTQQTITFDTALTGDGYADLGCTISSGVVSIPAAAQVGRSFFRVSVFLDTNDSGASYCTCILYANHDGTNLAFRNQTRHAFGGNMRHTLWSPWLPFLTATPQFFLQERADTGTHAATTNSIMQVEFA